MRRWTVIRRICGNRRHAMRFMEVVQNKFPGIKFKLGETRFVTKDFLLYSETPVLAYLPTPHPNEESRQIYVYADNLIEKITYEESVNHG